MAGGFHIDADIPPVPQSTPKFKFPNPFDLTSLKYGFALTVRDYEPDVRKAEQISYLPFYASRIIRILAIKSNGWLLGEVDGQQGWFPDNFVVAMDTPLPTEDIMERISLSNRARFRKTGPFFCYRPHDGADQGYPPILDPFVRALSRLQSTLIHRTGSNLRSMASDIESCAYSVLDIDRSSNLLQIIRTHALSALTGLIRMVEHPDPHEVEILGAFVANHTDMTLFYAHLLFSSLSWIADAATFARASAYPVATGTTQYCVWTSLPSPTMSSDSNEREKTRCPDPHPLIPSLLVSASYLPYSDQARRDGDVGRVRSQTGITMAPGYNSRSDRLSHIYEDEDEDIFEGEDANTSEDDVERGGHDQWEVSERNEAENVGEGELNYNAVAAALAEMSPQSTQTSSSGTTWTSYGTIWFARSLTVSSSDSPPQFTPPQFTPPQFLPYHSPPQFLPFHSPPQVSPFHSPPRLPPFHSAQQFSNVFHSPHQFATFHSRQEMSPSYLQ